MKKSLPHAPDSHRDSRPVFGYIRVSSNQQEIERQERTLPEQHKRLPDGLSQNDLVLFTDEGISAYKDTHRPGFEELRARIARGEASALLIDTSSRLTRQGIREALELRFALEDADCRLFTTQGREYEAGLSGLIGLAVDAERDNAYSRDLAHNVKTGRERIAALGGWSGGPAPIGYCTERHPENGRRYLVPDERAPAIQEAFRRYADGETIYRVATFLAESLTDWPRSGNRDPSRLRHATRKILRNRTYLGLIPRRREKKWLPGLHEPLVDKETFERCQARLDSNARDWQGIKPVQSFGNRLRWGTCGGRAEFHRPRKDWTYYRCASPDCRKRKATASYVEAAFVYGLAATAHEIWSRLDDPTWAITKANASDLATTEKEIAGTKRHADYVLDKALAEEITREQADTRLAELKEKRESLEARALLLANDGAGLRKALADLRDDVAAWGLIAKEVFGVDGVEAISWAWAAAPVEAQRSLVERLVERVELHKDEIKISFRAGITIPVPIISGQRERRFAPALETLGFGKPRSLADLPTDEREVEELSRSFSSHSSTAPRREVGAFSQ